MGLQSRRTIRREAVGVVAAITPWNFPNQINLAKIGPALAAGNTVVLKPAPDTPWLAADLGRLAAAHPDLPAGAINGITTRSETVAAKHASGPRTLNSFVPGKCVALQVTFLRLPTYKTQAYPAT